MPLKPQAARNLASTTKTAPIWPEVTPRWILLLLPWIQVEAGKFRINRVESSPSIVSEKALGETLPQTYSDYYDEPPVIDLTTVQTTVEIHTRVADLYSSPFDQKEEQFRLAIQGIKEQKEYTLFNSPEFGLLTVADPRMRISTTSGPPTPDDMDNLLALVWKMPAFFLAHPRAIAGFGQQCTAKGINLGAVEMFGVPFVTWRGVPIVPTDKIPIAKSQTRKAGTAQSTSVLLLRVGEEHQGVVGLHQKDVGDENFQSLVVRFMGINSERVSTYLLTCYFAAAVLAYDALGVLDVKL